MKSSILITGAAGGLGKAFAVECAHRGWDLVLTDLDCGALVTLGGALERTYGVQVQSLACDLTDMQDRTRLFTELRRRVSGLWGVINVAGMEHEGLFYERSREQIVNIVRLNIEATLDITHAALAFRDPYVTFRIINVASLAAFNPMPVKATYAASKRFLVDFSLALREEVRPLGATVTVLCPAGLPTKADSIRGIEAQGVMGLLTTQNIGSVAAETVEAALKDRALVTPGFLNRLIQLISSLAPAPLAARLIGKRWMAAYGRKAGQPL